MSRKRNLINAFLVMVGLVALTLVYAPISNAQNWIALPPYNTLWPLWSPALSPVDAVTGLPVPIVSELIPSTVLPVQPGLTWDPAASNPWLLYNTPLGMAYYDPINGINMWPPSYLIDPSGSPFPIALPTDYAFLPPTPSTWITSTVPLANAAAFFYLMTIAAPVVPTTVPVVPVATPIFGPTATPIIGPVGTPIFGPTFFSPIIGGVPLFLAPSAII